MNYVKSIKLRCMPDAASYLSELPCIRYLSKLESLPFSEPVTFFVGENGTGKSTLIEAIAVAMGFNAEGGSRDHMFTTKNTCSELSELLTIVKTVPPKDGFFLRAESFYNTATYLDEYSQLVRYGMKSFHKQSHGESFLALIEHRFEGHGLYILDEPEAALSPQKLLSLIPLIDLLVKQDSQFLIATHSPILMAYPHAQIYQFSEKGIQSVAYRDTEHFQTTKMFLDNPERMIHYLLDENDE